MRKVILMMVIVFMIGLIGCRKSEEIVIEETEVEYEMLNPGDTLEEEYFIYSIIDDKSVKVIAVKTGAIDTNGVLNVPEKTMGDSVLVNGEEIFMKGGRAVIIIGKDIMKNNVEVKQVNMPSIIMVEEQAFYGCNALKEVDMPEVKEVGRFAFRNCNALITVNMPAVETLLEETFRNCGALETVNMPMVKTVDKATFYLCKNLIINNHIICTEANGVMYVKIDQGNAKILNITKKIVGEMLIPLTVNINGKECNVTKVGVWAFGNCTGLTSVKMPGIKMVGSLAFLGCNALLSVSMPMVEMVENVAFDDCSVLKTVLMPVSSCCFKIDSFEGCKWQPQDNGVSSSCQ